MLYLITACKDEAQYIEKCIKSVLNQTLLPKKWIIVDDGSSDRTPDIIKDFAQKHPFISLIQKPQRDTRSFGEQYRAINEAFSNIKHEPFDFIGFLDADIALKQNVYLETIISEFSKNSSLGICGGYLIDVGNTTECLSPFNSCDTVPGGIQIFRTQCYTGIGTYIPLELGGSDTLAELRAKKNNWEVKAVSTVHAYHYRPASSAGGTFKGAVRYGFMDANFGTCPIFETLKCARRTTAKPWKIGGIIRFLSYLWFFISCKKSSIDHFDRAFLRILQRRKISHFFSFSAIRTASQNLTKQW